MPNLDIFSFIALYTSFCFSILSIVFHGVAYFILLIENDAKVDFSKIKIEYIKYILEGLLNTKSTGLDIEGLRKDYA